MIGLSQHNKNERFNNALRSQKQPDNFDKKKIPSKSKVGKIFDGEMFIRTRPTNLLQIFCKMIVNFKVIVKSMKDPDDTRWDDGLTKD